MATATRSRRSEPARAAQAAPAPMRFEDFVSFRLHRLVSVNERAASALYGRLFDLGLNEWRVLAILAERGRLTAKQLAKLTDLDKSRVSRVVAALAARGYLLREANAEDGRSVLLRASPAGLQACQRILPVSQARQERLLSCLSALELRRFDEALAKLEAQTRRMYEDERDGHA